MSLLSGSLGDLLAFLVVITILVFVHELGHYLAARWCGIRVEVFSIGFGPELFGWHDRKGTRWRISAVPLGGYVKMFGDTDPASAGALEEDELTPEERAVAFAHKPLGSRTIVVGAGPMANFVFAFVTLAVLFAIAGEPVTTATNTVGAVVADSAAAEAGLKAGDVIVGINDHQVTNFDELRHIVLTEGAAPLTVHVQRDKAPLDLTVAARAAEVTDETGKHQEYRIGVQPGAVTALRPVGPLTAASEAAREVWVTIARIADDIWRLLTGAQSVKDLHGVIGIGQVSGEAARSGPVDLVLLIALISVNLGLMNLLPIPVLDGGHLLFYAAEAVRGRPLGRRVREFGMGVGLALIATLVIVANWNDLANLSFFKSLKVW